MKVRTRLLLAFTLILSIGMYWLVDWIVRDVRLHYFITMEESLVDTSVLLAEQVAQTSDAGRIVVNPSFSNACTSAARRNLSASIYSFSKTNMNLRVIVVDRESRALFDSRNELKNGAPYRWRDSRLTLQGEYGARATYEIPGDQDSLHFYVAAPVIVNGKIIGAVSVGKPVSSIRPFMSQARSRLIMSGIIGFAAVIVMLIPVSLWIIHPIKALTRYAHSIRDGKKPVRPTLGHGGEMSNLADAFEEMRDALEGKKYVEEYVQSLTHEMKSPLAAIQGATELLHEEIPPDQRARFLSNIRTESTRLHQLIERMLSLASIEKRKGLNQTGPIDLQTLLKDLSNSLHPILHARTLTFKIANHYAITLQGDYFLLRQALTNLLQNAIDFSPADGTIEIDIKPTDDMISFLISDEGPGLPDYAKNKVFDRFYSLPRPETGIKSSGLGLNFVREIARLHNGHVSLSNRDSGGATAVLTIPSV